ncbi:MAG: putative HTH-type transcriptional repressor ExuR [Oscillospiraceae bacterium]|jgi:DNA-binding LacI/PurR family transcriptional regulator
MKKKVTMKDIATRLHVSINAVSLALNNKGGVSSETRNRIIDTAERMGYFKDKKKYTNVVASKNICILIKKQYFRNSTFYAKILLGVEQEAKRKGYDVLIHFGDQLWEIPECVKMKRVCGIISIGQISDEYLMELKKHSIPIILVDHSSMCVPVDCVLSDNKLGSYQMTQLLIERGYRRIGFFGDLDYSMSIKERFFGYCQAIHSMAFEKNNNQFVDYILQFSVLNDIEKSIIQHDTIRIVQKIRLLKQIPQAFVCSNDEAAIQLIYALNQLNYNVPDDIVVTGFDNAASTNSLMLKLATVNVRKEEMGQIAVRKLLDRIEHLYKPFENTVLSVEIVNKHCIKQI